MALATLSIDLVAKLAQFEADLGKAAREAEKRSEQMAQSLQKVATAATAVLGAVSLGAITAVVRAQVDAIDGFNDLSDATGASIENISALDNIARRTGATFDSVSGILVKFNSALKEASPDSASGQVFKALGLDIEALKKADPAEALRTTAQAFQKFAADGDSARAVQELFGKSVKEAAPFLKDLADATEFVGTVTADQADAVDTFNKQLFALQSRAQDSVRTFALELLPTLSIVIDGFSKGGAAVNVMGAASEALKITIQTVAVLGSDLVFVFKGLGRELGAIAAQAAAIARLDFAGAGVIRRELIADNEAARAQLDAFQRRVMGLDAASAPTASGGARPSLQLPASKPGTTDKLAEQGAKLADSLLAQESGLSADFLEKWDKLSQAYQGNAISLEKLTEAQAALLRQQPFMKKLDFVGDTSDALSRRLESLEAGRKALEALNMEIDRLADGGDQRKRDLTAQLEARLNAGELFTPEQLERIVNGIAGISGGIDKASESTLNFADVFQSRFEDAILKGQQLSDVLKGLAQDILQLTLRETITKPLATAASSSLKSMFAFKDGGVMTSAGPLPLRAYAGGGVADRPQVALFGEGSTPEAFVPLPDGRRIPVAMKGGGGSVTIINNVTTSDVASKADIVAAMRVVSARQAADARRSDIYGMR